MAGGEYFFEEGCFIRELLNSEGDPDVSVARARVRSGETTRWHRLEGLRERYIILDGNGRVEVGTRPAHDVGTGDVVQIAPGERQRITNSGDRDLVFLAVCTPRFSVDAYEDIEEDIHND